MWASVRTCGSAERLTWLLASMHDLTYDLSNLGDCRLGLTAWCIVVHFMCGREAADACAADALLVLCLHVSCEQCEQQRATTVAPHLTPAAAPPTAPFSSA